MRLNPPKKNVWWITLVLGVIGFVARVVAYFVTVPLLSELAFWLMVVALALLLLANVLTGL